MRRSPLHLDLTEGLREVGKWYFVCAALAASSAISFALTARARGFSPDEAPCNFGNLTACAFAGMEAFLPSPSEPFQFPVSWALMMLLVTYMTLGYPYRDLMGFGQKVLISSANRRSWWLSKCVWTTVCVLLFWTVFLGVTALASMILGGGLGLEISPSIEKVLRLRIPVRFNEMDYLAFLCSILPITTALCLAQLCLSLFVTPMISYLAMFSLLFLSAFYYQAPFLLGNYLMALRTPGFAGSGFHPAWGVLLAVLLSMCSIAIGDKRFSHMDILEKES